MNLQLSVIYLRFGDSLFQAAGPVTKKALSPKPVLVPGTSKEPDVEDLRIARSCSVDIGYKNIRDVFGTTAINWRANHETQFVMHSESN